jgi:hypothetical protein
LAESLIYEQLSTKELFICACLSKSIVIISVVSQSGAERNGPSLEHEITTVLYISKSHLKKV